jgi:SPP1 gp7 family putative phage head morphogenesis protein
MPADASFLLTPVPNEQAAAWIADKPVVSRKTFDTLLPELQARAFVIAGIEDANVVADIRATVAELPAGESWDAQKKQIEAKLGAWFEPQAAASRATLLLRTHGFQAYRTAAHEVMSRQKSAFPFWQYLTVGDERVRPSHRAMDGIIAPANSKFWDDKPGGWGCRCRKAPLTEDEVAEIRREEAAKPVEEKTLLAGPRLRAAEDGRLVRAVRDDRGRLLRDPIQAWPVANPGKIAAPQTLRLNLTELESRYDPATWSDFRRVSRRQRLPDGRSVWQWLISLQ